MTNNEPSVGAGSRVATSVFLFNTVVAGIGALYASTNSVMITAIAAGVAGILGVVALLAGRR